MRCTKCGNEFDKAKFCPECGEPVKNTIRCRRCDYDVDSNMKFCPECGEPVQEYSDSRYKDDKYKDDKKYKDKEKDKRRRRRDGGDGDDDDEEGGILGGIGDIVGNIFGK